MHTNDISTPRLPEVLAPGTGHHLHFLNHLATVKVSPGTSGAMSVVEFTAERGFGPPLHQHRDEDELFVVLEGAVAFHAGDVRALTEEGAIALLPAGLAHTFQVHSTTARFVCVTAVVGAAARFDQLVTALGTPVASPTLPAPGPIDPGHVAEVCQTFGVDVLGPPLPPLDAAV